MNEDKTAMDFWGRVEIAQKDAGYSTLKALCNNAGVFYNTITNNRSQSKLPRLDTAVSLAHELKRPVEWLMYGEKWVDYSDRDDVLQNLSSDPRLYEIAKSLLEANANQLIAVEVALGIKK